MAQQVFISYASADQVIAERVCAALENTGVSCWIAPRNIEPGKSFPAAIVEAVRSSSVFVLILTEHAAASPHILSEVGHAFNARKRIVPFRLSPQDLPEDLEYFLSMTQWLDALDGCTDQNLKRLTEAVSEALVGERVPRYVAPLKRRARWFAIAAALFLAAAGIVVYWKWPRTQRVNSLSSSPPAGIATSSAAPAALPQRKTWVNPDDGQNYVWIPPGAFTMGCSPSDGECQDDEKPAHPVTIDKGYWLGQTEVTIAAYRRFAARHGLKSPTGDDKLPVSDVAWAIAKEYCAAAGGRLPTEAEWEYAARGGSSGAYYGPVSDIAWYAHNSGGAPHEVGKKQPNAFGLYDMLGNVAEWVRDRYFNKYDLDSPATGTGVEEPLAPNASAVARGGFWGSEAASIRVSRRLASENGRDDPDLPIGFRCAVDRP